MKKYTWAELVERCTKELAKSAAGYKKLAEQTAAFSHYSAWRAFCDHFGTATPISTSVVESFHDNGFAKQWQPPLGYLKD